MSVIDQTAAPPAHFDRRLLLPMMLGAILNPINSSIIAVALVPIGVALGAPARETAWLISGLYIATAIGQPLMGRFVDERGARPVFLVGASLTLLAGIVGTMAGSIWMLVAARVVLGFGTCAGYPSAMRIIRDEADRTGSTSPAGVLAALTLATQTISVVGPVLGGVLIDVGGWRSTFAINIVLGIAGLVLGALLLPPPAANRLKDRPRMKVDYLGIVAFAGTLTSLLLFLTAPSTSRLALLAIAVVLAVGFTLWELRRPDPFIDLRVFGSNVPLVLTYVRAVLASLVSYGFIYGFTQWLQEGRGLTPSASGLLLLPTFGLGIAVVALTGTSPVLRGKLIVGAVFQVVACVLILLLHDDSPIVLLIAITLVLGIPQGLVSLANQNAVFHQARGDQVAAAAGLLRTFFYFGAIASSAAGGLFFGERATTTGMHQMGLVMLSAGGLMLLMSLLDRSLAKLGRPSRR